MANECGDNAEHHISQDLTSADKTYAAEHLNETDETRENAVAEIKRWVEEELRIRINDFLILRFLRIYKFNIEPAKIRIRNYYKHQSDLPEWYMNKDPFQPELRELIDMGLILPLRKPDNKGRLVYIIRGTLHDPTRHAIPDLFKVYTMIIEIAVKYYPAASVYGYVAFVDVINPTIRQMLQVRPSLIMHGVHWLQNCCPLNHRMFNVFNMPKVLETFINIGKSFMNETAKSRVHVYSHANCFKDIPVEILPIEYGGTDETCQKLTEYWKKLIEENRDWFVYNDENNKIE